MLQPAFAIVTAGSSSEYEIQPAFTGRTHSKVFKMRFMEKICILFSLESLHGIVLIVNAICNKKYSNECTSRQQLE